MLRKIRSVLALSDKLNTLTDKHAIARHAIGGITAILNANAGLIVVSGGANVMYSKHRSSSIAIEQLARTLAAGGPMECEPTKRVYSRDQLLFIQLLWRERQVGLIALDRQGLMPVPAEEALILLLANQLAALFGREDKSEGQNINDSHPQPDIQGAVAVQESLLPSIPSSSTCGLSIATHTRAAEYIGGDYFDLVRIDEDKIGIVIADVEGKGVPAALFGNMLRTTVHFLTRETPSTSSVVAKINAILHKEAVASKKLFSLFYAVYNPTNRMLTYTGSGHVCPLVFRAGSKHIDHLRSDGTLIGIAPTQHFNERSVQLAQGDLVAFFTDGVIDYCNEAGQAFGEHRVIHSLAAHEEQDVEQTMNALLNDLSKFTTLPPTDDLTIILTKVT